MPLAGQRVCLGINTVTQISSKQFKLTAYTSPKTLPVPHFVQVERDRDVEMVWENGLGDIGREGGHDSYHTT